MNDSYEKLIRDYLDGQISQEDLEKLNQVLEKDQAARARFRLLATLEEGLRDLAEVSPYFVHSTTVQGTLSDRTGNSSKSSSSSPFFKRPVFAAAAGLVIGIFFTSAIWAASESGRQKLRTLIYESFEFGPSPGVTGMPMETGIWSGDYSEIVPEQDGITPKHGEHMLRFLRADFEGKNNPEGYICDIYRVIDLHSYESTVPKDDAVISVEAAFSSVPSGEPNRFQGGIWINALSDLPTEADEWKSLLALPGKLNKESLATSLRWFNLPSSGEPWQKARLDLLIPAEARYLIVSIQAIDRGAIPPTGAPPAVEFPGQYIDDIRISIRRQHSND